MTDTELVERQAAIIKEQENIILELRNENAQLKNLDEGIEKEVANEYIANHVGAHY